MREQTIKSIERRLRDLEREAVRLRKGVMTSSGIDLGDSGVAHDDVAAVGTAAVGSTVAVLARGHGLLSLGQIGAGAVSSSLPASPSHGEIAFYRPSTGVIWQCIYDSAQDSADGNGWVVVGPTDLSDYTASSGASGSATWVLGGLQLTIPRAGVWDVTLGARMYADAAATQPEMSTSGAGTSSGHILLAPIDSADAFSATHPWRETRVALTAGTLLERLRRGSGSGTANFSDRHLRARPVRLAS